MDTTKEPLGSKHPKVRTIRVEEGAEAFLELLRALNVDYIFASPGTDWRSVWDFLAKFHHQGKVKPRYIQCLHEALSIDLASGYQKITGRPQVVLLHTILGATNAAMHIQANNYSDISMICASATARTFEGELKGSAQGPHYFRLQESDFGALIRPYVKWYYEIHTNANLHKVVARAFQVAKTDPQGPVYLFFAEELLEERVRSVKIPDARYFTNPVPSQPDIDTLKKTAELLINADRPLILTDCLGKTPTAVSYLLKLAELLAIPVVDGRSYMNFPTSHALHLGYSTSPFLEKADVVLVINHKTPWMPPQGPAEEAKIIVLDCDPVCLKFPYWGFPADVSLAGCSEVTISALLSILSPLISGKKSLLRKFHNRFQKLKVEHERQRLTWKESALEVKNKKPIDMKWLSYIINEVITDDMIIVREAITPIGATIKHIERTKAGTWFSQERLAGGLGQGMGNALGAKLASPDTTVICLSGDGCFNYNPVTACLWCAQAYGIPILVVLYNNQSYQSMMDTQLDRYPEGWGRKTGLFYGARLDPAPNYVKIANAFNAYGEKVNEPTDIRPALLRALDHVKKGKLALLDIIIASAGSGG